jgi:alpha-galactosidase
MPGIIYVKKMARHGVLAGVCCAAFLMASGFAINAYAVKAPCLTPPMGWNSYDSYSYAVTQAQFMANAHYMADSLKKYGWEYCIVDFIWWIPQNGRYGNNQSSNWSFGRIDQYGRFLPDTTRFPSAKGDVGFKALADSVHNLGLKFGIHVMRGVPRMAARNNTVIYNSTYTCKQAADTTSTCSWMDWMWGTNMNSPAGQAYLNSILELYDSWDVDFIKVDDLSSPYHTTEVVGYANAIASVSREIVLSTSPGPTPLDTAHHIMQYANQWRLVNDLWDDWNEVKNGLVVAQNWRNKTVNGSIVAGAGHWPDVDMLPFGHLSFAGFGPVGNPRYSDSLLTKGQHKVLFFLYCISNNPLMWGGNLPDNNHNPFFDSLMMCSEAIFINQHGIKGRVLKSCSSSSPSIWVSTHPTDTTTKYIYMADTTNSSLTASVTLNTIGFSSTEAVPVYNVWTKAGLENSTGTFTQTIAAHDAVLFRLGNGTPTSINNVSGINQNAHFAAEKVFCTIGNECVIPSSYSGQTVKVSVYDPSGKLLKSVVTRECSIMFDKGNVHGQKVSIVKISVVNAHGK